MAIRVSLLLACIAAAAPGAEYYVAPDGDDAAAGGLATPFATLARAQQGVAPGDTVFIRGGTYRHGPAGIAATKDLWAYVQLLDTSGVEGRPITYAAFRDERPVFDFRDVAPPLRINAFQVTGSWLRLVGIEITGVRGVLTGHAQSACIENTGSHNRFERIAMHDNEAIGFYGVRGRDVEVVDCDAWNNHDQVAEDGRGGNSDGFGCHPPRGGTGWVFRRCRAWLNADDGFDCIAAYEPVVFEECWAFHNGYDAARRPLADGNGFKAGGYGSLPAARLPAEIPR
ncbi:MAG: pectate lyase, partial [Planctomycetia bacterium]|nr:pectate lyase [Planctomycetia bacterium]